MIERDAEDAEAEIAIGARGAEAPSLFMQAVICLQIVAAMLVFACLFQTRPHRDTLAIATIRPVARPAVLPPPPAVLPMDILKLAPETARALNAAVPIDTAAPLSPAAPFVFTGSKNDRANAMTCLAAAEIYEAGDDKQGEQAVAQVVLNRVRHPAFPKTVCGVVFQGSERSTGCQFTFTCDGALARTLGDAAWKRAQALAEEALSGAVFKEVGTATHYHADYVVPYWRDSLDKIAQVGAHIFYRWRGWWGTPAAFSGRYTSPEVIDARLARLSGAQAIPTLNVAPETFAIFSGPMPAVLPRPLVAEGVSTHDLQGNVIRVMDARAGQYALLLDGGAYPGSYAVAAYALCKVRPSCEVMGWLHEEMLPNTLPPPPANAATMAFRFIKTSLIDHGDARWNCQQIHRDHLEQCIPGTDVPTVQLPPPPGRTRAGPGRAPSKSEAPR